MSRFIRILTVLFCVSLSQNMWASSVSESDSLALVALYNSTNGANWVKSDNWLNGSFIDWYGVVCEDGKVIAINLSGNNLDGQLPEELYALSDLEYIYVSFNDLGGQISESIASLSKLKVFWASNNNFSGNLPNGIGGMDSLKTLYLNDNAFTGELPAALGQLINLENVNLANNGFSGVVPSNIGNLTALNYLTLSNNKFSGELPASLQNLSLLKTLRIDYNKFSGIPDLSGLKCLVNSDIENEFRVQYNYLDFTDLAPNKMALGAENNYFPQRNFSLTNIINLHPGDSVHINMPELSYVDTSDARNSYRYVLDNSVIQTWSDNSGYTVNSAVYSDNGSYVCQVVHDSFPGLIIPISNVRMLPPSGKSWISLGVKIDGPIIDTIDYRIVAKHKINGEYKEVAVNDTLLNKRKEFLIPTGTYLLDLVPQGKDSVFFRKYHKNNLRWVNSQLSTFGNRRDYAYNISLIEKVYSNGTGQISGNIVESELNSDDPLFNPQAIDSVKVLLYSKTLSIWVQEQETDAAGNYMFTDLEEGDYAIYIDYPGFIQEKVSSLTISSDEPKIDSINFTLYLQNNVVVGIEHISMPKLNSDELSVYADNYRNIQVSYGAVSQKIIDVAIYNLSGKLLYRESMNGSSTTIRMPDVSQGIYILQARTKNSRIAKKFVVR